MLAMKLANDSVFNPRPDPWPVSDILDSLLGRPDWILVLVGQTVIVCVTVTYYRVSDSGREVRRILPMAGLVGISSLVVGLFLLYVTS